MKIAVASGKGGTGKTFFSTNLFAALRQAELDVALVDCDAEVPDAAIFIEGDLLHEEETRLLCPSIDPDRCNHCGLCAGNCHFNAITCIPSLGYIKVHPDLCHSCGACILECPQHAVRQSWKTVGKVSSYGNGNSDRPYLFEARMDEGEHSPVPVIRQAVRKAERFDYGYLVLDAPPGCSCPFVNTVMDTDRVILVSEPTPFGLSDLKHTVEVLKKLGKEFQVVINRSDIGNDMMKSWLEAEKIGILAEIPYSKEIASIYARGKVAYYELESIRILFNGIIGKLLQV